MQFVLDKILSQIELRKHLSIGSKNSNCPRVIYIYVFRYVEREKRFYIHIDIL